jgi:hypothetical protein
VSHLGVGWKTEPSGGSISPSNPALMLRVQMLQFRTKKPHCQFKGLNRIYANDAVNPFFADARYLNRAAVIIVPRRLWLTNLDHDFCVRLIHHVQLPGCDDFANCVQSHTRLCNENACCVSLSAPYGNPILGGENGIAAVISPL